MIYNLLSISKTIIATSIFIIILTLLFSSFEVNGRSMTPTLNDGDRVLILKLNYINLPFLEKKLIITSPKKDSIIAFQKEDGVELIKRVIALPNDEVDIKNQTVYVNNSIQGRGLGLTSPKNTFPITLEDDCIFVLGDNRNLSNDSRAFGCVPIENIKGNLALRLWPIKDIKLFR
ncbi:MAG: signal peptidase I [Dehalococcoidales bacterium]|nr:signal peptidase I [Dehalococcoidales bacterium]